MDNCSENVFPIYPLPPRCDSRGAFFISQDTFSYEIKSTAAIIGHAAVIIENIFYYQSDNIQSSGASATVVFLTMSLDSITILFAPLSAPSCSILSNSIFAASMPA